jgi:endonuclease-3
MPRETLDQRKQRAIKIIEILQKEFPDATCSLDWKTPFQLLVATILSAQCTDKRVNLVTPGLFKKYPHPKNLASATPEELEEDIRSTGFYRNKAKNLRGAARKILDDFGGHVPDNMDDLLTLPGVARKTANVILGEVFDKREGVVVDTHVSRLAVRLKLTRHEKSQAQKIEADLMSLLPRPCWRIAAHVLVFHGRTYCMARNPDCQDCPIQKLCPSAFKI